MPWLLNEDEWPEVEEGLTVYETDDDLVVKANVPGVSEDEVDVSIDSGVITIKAEHKEKEEEKKKKKVVYRRAMQAKYLYTTNIPCPVKADKAKAELKNGVLTITLPKAEEAKPKKIAVKAKA
jgi:HSP20 family protein